MAVSDGDAWSKINVLFSKFVIQARANAITDDLFADGILTHFDMAELQPMPDNPAKRRSLLMRLYGKDPKLYPVFLKILNRHYPHFAEVLDPGIQPESQPKKLEQAPVFNDEVRASDIPFLPCLLIHGKIEDSVTELHLAGVSARYSPGALPVNTNICMMVRPIEEGYSFKGVTFSPQVIVGPHLANRLMKPLTLTFPLRVQGRVTALVSKTAAEESPHWQVSPESSVKILKDQGLVEVSTYEHCRHQVQSGLPVIKLLSEFVYFSVSAKLYESTHHLKLHCSGNKDLCEQPQGDFQLCHNVDDPKKVEVVNGDEVCLSMVSNNESIIQLSSPFLDQSLSCVLDEQFSIRVEEEQPSSQSWRGWWFPVWSSTKPKEKGKIEKDVFWRFDLPKGYGEGCLIAYPKRLKEVDDGPRSSGEPSLELTFKIGQPEGGKQLPAGRTILDDQPEEAIVASLKDCTFPQADDDLSGHMAATGIREHQLPISDAMQSSVGEDHHGMSRSENGKPKDVHSDEEGHPKKIRSSVAGVDDWSSHMATTGISEHQLPVSDAMQASVGEDHRGEQNMLSQKCMSSENGKSKDVHSDEEGHPKEIRSSVAGVDDLSSHMAATGISEHQLPISDAMQLSVGEDQDGVSSVPKRRKSKKKKCLEPTPVTSPTVDPPSAPEPAQGGKASCCGREIQ